MFDTSKIKQGIVAAIASVVLTATAVGAAVGPAETVASSPVYASVASAVLNG